MTLKRIFILNGNPAEKSLSRSFVETYAEKACAAGHEVRVAHLSELSFSADFGQGNDPMSKPLEPDLEAVMGNIEWSEHVVLSLPMWWGGMPSRLKALIDRAFVPGRAFNPRVTSKIGMPAPLLVGRTARVIVTSDTPSWFMRFVYGNALLRQLRGQVFAFVGIKPTRFTWIAGASHPEPGLVERWSAQVARLGTAGG
ncbi:Putative NADPH-quinone reductase (modulator of drug activity B) [Jannaschia faecimaris]|uniref:Putative NADPH-quinone reductase (Modulator of drug activity B) n=1 Tax=Jannaschia faecimaris TaxID=1244108 RepID=A0A1H3RRQ4_9RHOB|nr:NAD(P)H-dependent oxidoreductase [Jannaschia faecimaris]SDZ28386.1 Putative NADPH-quinone reductase (modulator of drug activity B) [Jannaschia faecimaris]